jgi:predicted nucleic acid-binding protein
MSAPVVLADANVLYSAILRDLLMEIAVRRGILLRWTDAIQDEWKRALLKNRLDVTAEQLRRTQQRMEAALPDARVTGYESLIDGLTLPDADDRHVLAAAITTGASLIVTFNTVDFPTDKDVRSGFPI